MQQNLKDSCTISSDPEFEIINDMTKSQLVKAFWRRSTRELSKMVMQSFSQPMRRNRDALEVSYWNAAFVRSVISPVEWYCFADISDPAQSKSGAWESLVHLEALRAAIAATNQTEQQPKCSIWAAKLQQHWVLSPTDFGPGVLGHCCKKGPHWSFLVIK